MSAAILVIDLVNDTFKHDTPVAKAARAFMPALNAFLAQARRAGHRVIFSTDSFLPGDFIFQGRMKEYSIRGTHGAEIAAEIHQEPDDVWLPKRRFSAFFKTDLDQTLRLWGVETVAVAGVTTQVCVLSTVFDALANDFRTVLLEDLTASISQAAHKATLDLYRNMPTMAPLLRVMTGAEFLEAMAKEESKGGSE